MTERPRPRQSAKAGGQQLEVYVRTVSTPALPDWLPKAVRHCAKELCENLATEKDPTKAQQVLKQLIANPLMKRVWNEIYRRKCGEDGRFFNPACLKHASDAAAYREKAAALRRQGGEVNNRNAEFLELEARYIELLPDEPLDPSWSEQDHAARLFLMRAYRAAFYTEPLLAADAQGIADKLGGVAKQLRKLAEDLKSIEIGVTAIYAEKLIEVAKDCESDATVTKPNFTSHPWLVKRKRGDTRRKTFVAMLFKETDYLFGKPMYSTIANVTNVVFSNHSIELGDQSHVKPITDGTVREMLRGHVERIRPSFGPLLYPRVKARRQELEAELERRLASKKRQASSRGRAAL
ncbi:MAG: hypothetical protein WBB34_17690 [Xanthobacteraceae bacterium]